MNCPIISWLLLAIATISIFSDVAGASASAQCLGFDQRSLLLELRNSLVFNASLSSKLVQWDRSADSWSGVTCEDGLVVGLDLSGESISGGIDGSSSLFKLEFIRSLNLAFNNFNSTAIPSDLANLSRLVHLNLSSARFAGKIPAELSRLTKLRTLDLSSSHSFDGVGLLKLEKPNLRSLIGDFGELRELYLHGVDVSAEGSEWCDALSSSVPKLEVLSMPFCSLSCPIGASLTSLANLSVIQLDFNNLSTTVPTFLANFSSLKTLSLRGCGLQGELTQEVFQVQTLRTLDLSFNPLLQISLPDFPVDSSLENLVLRETNISGRLPDSIGNLRKLSALDLSFCGLRGSIPISMENLSELTSLDLSDNSLEGDIPPALFTLPRLEEIWLSYNKFSGRFIIYPNVSSYRLDVLHLGSNLLQGSMPASIFEMRGLSHLSLSYNNFSGSINIDAFQGFENLTHLDLSYSGLSINTMASASAVASSFPNLGVLHLASCQLLTLPQFLANQSNLESLDLSHNFIQGEIPQWIWTLENLVFLNLSSNSFEGFQTASHNHTHALYDVDLHSDVRWPMYLDFSKNNFHGSIPKSICKVGYPEVLDLSHNHLNGTIPDCLMMRPLAVLNLRNNQLSGEIPQNILKKCSLKTLDISENLLQGQIPLGLANCTELEIVNIGDNQIDGTFPCHFKAISSLRVLVLRSNKLHGEIRCPHSHITWRMLQIVDLSSNDFSGTLPVSLFASWVAMKDNVDFDLLWYQSSSSAVYYKDTMSVTLKGQQTELVRILTIFTSIDFSGNRLEGPIPDTLGDLKALYFLNLSHNAISGSIPPILGNLHQLESLDLSWNYLNGTIPVQLANLDFLSFLNLSNNQLVGSIPASGQFLTFSKSSFEGNRELCGLQLNKSCSITTNGMKEAGDDGDTDDNEKMWFYMGMPFGFIFGFWLFCGPLVFVQSWQFAYYRFWDKVLFRHSRP